jgi:hypothetical protein
MSLPPEGGKPQGELGRSGCPKKEFEPKEIEGVHDISGNKLARNILQGIIRSCKGCPKLHGVFSEIQRLHLKTLNKT